MVVAPLRSGVTVANALPHSRHLQQQVFPSSHKPLSPILSLVPSISLSVQGGAG